MSNYRNFDVEMLELVYFSDALCRLACGANITKRLKAMKIIGFKTKVLDLAYRISVLLDGDSWAGSVQSFTLKYVEYTKEMKKLRSMLDPVDQKKLFDVVRKNKSLAECQMKPNARIENVLENVSWVKLEKGDFDLSKKLHW